MHELSIAQGIVELAEQQAGDRKAVSVEELELEIGALAGIELSALDFALESSVRGTLLEKAKIVRRNVAGEGRCNDCEKTFSMNTLFSACPACGSYAVKIIRGKELRLKSIVIK